MAPKNKNKKSFLPPPGIFKKYIYMKEEEEGMHHKEVLSTSSRPGPA